MTNVTTFDQEIKLDEINVIKSQLVGKKPPRKKPLSPEYESKLRMDAVAIDRTDVGNPVADKLRYDVSAGLKFYIKKLPQYQIITKQISLIEEEMVIYKKNGSTSHYDDCVNMINDLTKNLKELKKIVKYGESEVKSIEEKNKINSEIKNSEKIKELTLLKKELSKQVNETTPAYWVGKIKDGRYQISLVQKKEQILDFDEEISNTSQISDVEQEYNDLCGKVADLINWDIIEVQNSSLNKIKIALEENLPLNYDIKNKIVDIDAKISYERNLINGTIQVTDLIFNVFDLENVVDNKISKELLALSNINYVKMIAYSKCKKYNSLNKLDDAVSAGLEGLSNAINRWIKGQIKFAETSQSFKNFAASDIGTAIQRELLNLSGQGTARASTMATIDSNNKKKIQYFIKANPAIKDLDISIIMDLMMQHDALDTTEIKSGVKRKMTPMLATDFTQMVGGDDNEGSTDIFENSTNSDDDIAEMYEAKIAYEKMLKSISDILNLFDTKENKLTGISEITNKKLFDKYQRKHFMMHFGLEHKLEKVYDKNGNEDTSGKVKQDDIAMELFLMQKMDGLDVTKPMSQSAISTRLEEILKKLNKAFEINPSLKTGFEYFINIKKNDSDNPDEKTVTVQTGSSRDYVTTKKISDKAGNWRLTHPELLSKLSNSREEFKMKIDRQTLKEKYSDNQNILNKTLADGKTLADTFEVSDTNPLDDEIAKMFQ